MYDNLGLEPVWKRCKVMLVSDAGARIEPDAAPAKNWLWHTKRVLDVIDNQVRSLRARMLIAAYENHERQGAYWGIRTDIQEYGLADALPCPKDKTAALAAIPTRLSRFDEDEQMRLINWGYAVSDAGLRKYVLPGAQAPAGFPYPDAGLG